MCGRAVSKIIYDSSTFELETPARLVSTSLLVDVAGKGNNMTTLDISTDI